MVFSMYLNNPVDNYIISKKETNNFKVALKPLTILKFL